MDKYIIATYGAKNLDKVKKNMREGAGESRKRFLAKYPYADVSKFEFQTVLNKTGDISKYTAYYKIDDDSSYDITSDAFLNNKGWTKYLYWQRPWGVKGTVQTFALGKGVSYTINAFRIYATDDLFFDANLDDLGIVNNKDSTDYKDNGYLAALYAAYIATYSCGISTEHFEYNENTPKIITSIARYHLYYHMRRFIQQPSKMNRFVTKEMTTLIMNRKPFKYVWEPEFLQSLVAAGHWLSKQPKNSVRNVKSVLSKYGQVGISYEKNVGTTINALDDYKVFIATKSNGLTKTGQLLFQQSVESYVYCVLGAQAKTRWPIAGRGAMSLQSQEVFHKLVNDTVIQSDQTVAVSNMRKAVKDTNVILNTAISPGVMLVPSNMIILDEMIVGYNNILTLAAVGMRFGKNSAVNYFRPAQPQTTPSGSRGAAQRPAQAEGNEAEPRTGEDKPRTGEDESETVTPEPQTTSPAPKTAPIPERPTARTEVYLAAVTLVGGGLVARFVI